MRTDVSPELPLVGERAMHIKALRSGSDLERKHDCRGRICRDSTLVYVKCDPAAIESGDHAHGPCAPRFALDDRAHEASVPCAGTALPGPDHSHFGAIPDRLVTHRAVVRFLLG